jgi:phosphate transport system substrate-binding protein
VNGYPSFAHSHDSHSFLTLIELFRNYSAAIFLSENHFFTGESAMRKILQILTIALAGALLLNAAAARADDAALTVDPALSAYKKTGGVAGNLSSVGSDTLNNLMTLWAEGFNKYYPGVKVQVEGKGSSTAPPALIAGTAQLGPMSRSMKATEIDQFEQRFGYPPTEIKVAVDALAVFVHRDNPIEGLALDQVDAVFSKSRRLGAAGDITTWNQIDQSLPNKPISLHGRNSASGTYGFFRQVALEDGDYKDSVKEQPGSAAVVQALSVDRFGIGYSGIGYATAGVKAVPLAAQAGGDFVKPTADNSYSGEYPLSRFLYIYVNKAPGRPAAPIVWEFIRYVLSSEGQTTVIKDGYYPVSVDIAEAESAKLE